MDGFWEDDLDLWDTAAGVLLVTRGGRLRHRLSRLRPRFRARRIYRRVGSNPLQAAKARRGRAEIVSPEWLRATTPCPKAPPSFEPLGVSPWQALPPATCRSCLFLIIALGLSDGVRRAADDRRRASPARTSPTRPSSANMNAASRRSRTPAPSSTSASTWSRSCSSSSTSKRRSCSPGRSASTSPSWTGWVAMMVFLVELGARPRLCVEEGRARMGVMLDAPAKTAMPTEEELARARRPGSRRRRPEAASRSFSAASTRRASWSPRPRTCSPGRGPARCGG